MQKLVAGIGPRKTPIPILHLMTQLSSELSGMGLRLRSGHGRGADQAWATGFTPAQKEIWLPCSGFNGATDSAQGYEHYHVTSRSAIIRQIAREYHPKYDTCSDFIQSLFDRNVNIILGAEAAEPVDGVVFWQPQDNNIDDFGGTNHSLRIAMAYNIPCFNIELGYDRQKLEEFIHDR